MVLTDGELYLTKAELKYIRYIRTRGFSVYGTRSICDVVCWFVERKYGWPKI